MDAVVRPGDWMSIVEGLYAGIEARVLEVARSSCTARARLQLPLWVLERGLDADSWQPFWNQPLTEADWLTTTDTPRLERHLFSLPRPPSPRRWRLFACACADCLRPMLP